MLKIGIDGIMQGLREMKHEFRREYIGNTFTETLYLINNRRTIKDVVPHDDKKIVLI